MINKSLVVKFSNGEVYRIPVDIIAIDRARYYFNKNEFESMEKSLKEDTVPLFENDDYEIKDWAFNNMYWKDVSQYASKVLDGSVNYDSEWCNVECRIEKIDNS